MYAPGELNDMNSELADAPPPVRSGAYPVPGSQSVGDDQSIDDQSGNGYPDGAADHYPASHVIEPL